LLHLLTSGPGTTRKCPRARIISVTDVLRTSPLTVRC
jgi:hypothetical protein